MNLVDCNIGRSKGFQRLSWSIVRIVGLMEKGLARAPLLLPRPTTVSTSPLLWFHF